MDCGDWVSAILTVVGLIVSTSIMVYQFKQSFKQSKQEKITEQQRKLYTECFMEIEKIVNDNMLIFEKDYMLTLEKYKGLMKLSASNDVLQEFKTYCVFVMDCYNAFDEFCYKNNPENDVTKYECSKNEYGEIEDEIYHITENDMKDFEKQQKDYMAKHCPPKHKIEERVYMLLNKMRKDLNNDSYEW